MDHEWDLNAVVRSCTTPVAAGNTTTVEDYDDGRLYNNLEIIASGNESSPFSVHDPSFSSKLSGGLEDIIYKAGCSQIRTMSAGTTSTNSIDLDGEGFVHEQLPMLTDHSQSFSMHAMDSQSARPRKRKNQEKTVFQLTQEELSNDLWAWRKYGQKPIKGSPYPRNYYRCSTTKACGAKKQVERSPIDSTIFIVSYSGEHIHPRPTHRSSLAGSTRSNKFNTENNTKPPLSSTTIIEHPPCSSSSPASASSFSPTTSFKGDESEINEDDQCNENTIVPNMVMNEDVLKRFQDLNRGGGRSRGGSSF
ncbi:WRKY transcription factor 22-like [Rutidosis leptorrhynchoides]|uniref:WRKY transcription factor 22-like n=1 Tax=Rutidosis leptorrhynchoides TaxID=125765 RepID=UPI003A994817